MKGTFGLFDRFETDTERRTDLYLCTLRTYVEGVGGKLSLVVEFPDSPPVILTGLGESTSQAEKSAKKKVKPDRRTRSKTRRAA